MKSYNSFDQKEELKSHDNTYKFVEIFSFISNMNSLTLFYVLYMRVSECIEVFCV